MLSLNYFRTWKPYKTLQTLRFRRSNAGFFTRKPAMMTAFREITKSTTEHLGAARFNRPPRPAKRHGFSPPFTPPTIQQKCPAYVLSSGFADAGSSAADLHVDNVVAHAKCRTTAQNASWIFEAIVCCAQGSHFRMIPTLLDLGSRVFSGRLRDFCFSSCG